MVRKNNESISIFIVILLVILIITQTASMAFTYIKMNDFEKVVQKELSDTRNEVTNQCQDQIQMNNQDLENKITELSKNLVDTKSDIQKQVGSIKAETSSDFSGIVDSASKSVVSIKTDVSQGTGFIITQDGFVVTNAHVLRGASVANAITSDKEKIKMEMIGYDLNYDIALLKIPGTYQYLDLGNSDDIKVGEKVIAIGNPLGLSFSVSEGIVSAVHRMGSNGLSSYIQTDASLNPGNSGGPLIGTDGKVIGINNFKINGGENLGFALESNTLKEAVNKISKDNYNITVFNQ
jgi:S1-C subfamily serine protease